MESIIQQVTAEAVREAVKDWVKEAVRAAFEQRMEDGEFSDELEMLMGEFAEEKTQITTKPEPRFKSVFDFVDNFIRPMYPTTKNSQERANWSRQWYKHKEVGQRLEALWVIYERMRQEDPEGFLEKFLRDHADYHMRQIMADGGVFSYCSAADTPSIPLPVEPEKTKGETKK
ncbi:DUF4913 domain-containing protein [Corynebacterium mucifaciens]|uniref:DUF4913 domain-containing protein n=1 Tax=Corynebacterium mucifaciens TaxID=57171 RepID=A0A7X6LSK3_9CORY|nr:DUF4913 domain-containing protein [Corynebacterium mucifaciens]NKY69598.1 DUF4913 domain-containing protein [Corynebacterium mucifaciens]